MFKNIKNKVIFRWPAMQPWTKAPTVWMLVASFCPKWTKLCSNYTNGTEGTAEPSAASSYCSGFRSPCVYKASPSHLQVETFQVKAEKRRQQGLTQGPVPKLLAGPGQSSPTPAVDFSTPDKLWSAGGKKGCPCITRHSGDSLRDSRDTTECFSPRSGLHFVSPSFKI